MDQPPPTLILDLDEFQTERVWSLFFYRSSSERALSSEVLSAASKYRTTKDRERAHDRRELPVFQAHRKLRLRFLPSLFPPITNIAHPPFFSFLPNVLLPLPPETLDLLPPLSHPGRERFPSRLQLPWCSNDDPERTIRFPWSIRSQETARVRRESVEIYGGRVEGYYLRSMEEEGELSVDVLPSLPPSSRAHLPPTLLPSSSPLPLSTSSSPQYPMSPTILLPASSPIQYYRLLDAENIVGTTGKAKPFWRTFFELEAEGFESRVNSGSLDEKMGLPKRESGMTTEKFREELLARKGKQGGRKY